MRCVNKKLKSLVIQLIIYNYYFNLVFSLSLTTKNYFDSQKSSSSSRKPRQILATSAILLPNVGQYLALIQILVLKLVIWTQIMRLLGQDYVGKGIKSSVPLAEQQDLDEILDVEDIEADYDLNQNRRKRRKRNYDITDGRVEKQDNTYIQILHKLVKIIKLKTV